MNLERSKLFRHIQVLTVMVNGIQSGPAMILFVTALILVQALSLATLVGGQNSDFNLKATLLLLTVDSLMGMMMILGQMALVNQKTDGLLSSMRQKQYSTEIPIRERKWERRFYRSCLPLKIMVSSVSFVDKLTPLNCLDLSLDIAVNLLLLKSNN